MAVVEPLWYEPEPEERVNVVRLVTFLGPVSPELALVDPELGERARALLPATPGVRVQSRPVEAVLAPPAVLTVPVEARPRRGPRIAALVVAVALSGGGAGWWAATTVQDGAPAVATRQPEIQSPTNTEPESFPPPAETPPTAPARTAPAPAVSAPAPAATQPSRTVAPAPPRFVWPAQPEASGYRVALFRAGRRIFERDVVRPALALPLLWTYDGRSHSLTRGAYRWVVWPLVGREKRVGTAIVSAQYVA